MAPRRRRRGYIETLPSGRFRAVVYAGTDPLTGAARYIRETTVTHADAEKAAAKLPLITEALHFRRSHAPALPRVR